MTRNKVIDGIKGLAILSVVFYHLKILEYGYLGVDAFFVISGYLTAKSIKNKIQDNTFSYMGYLASRIVRLLPLVLIACAFSLVLGYWGMLPDDLENLSVSIIASNLMSENILSAITTKNYWDVVNDYKPLMHLWYVGLLLEFYIVYPLIESILNKVFARTKKPVSWNGGGNSFIICNIICAVSYASI